MKPRFRLGQSRSVQDLDAPDAYAREGKAQSKRRQQSAERLQTDIEVHDALALLRLPDAEPWMHLPEAVLVQRHSQWVDLELADRSRLRATLSGKLKGVKLTVGDRVRFAWAPQEAEDTPAAGAEDLRVDPSAPQAQVVSVMPRRSLLKRGGIDDREPWQLICANADELWICAALLDPPIRPGLLERAQVLALDAGLALRIVITKRDLAPPQDTLPELDPFRAQDIPIYETSTLRRTGLGPLADLLSDRVAVLAGHSGVGKSALVNALLPGADLRVGDMSRYGTGRQTTTAARWLPHPAGGTLVDTPGVRNLSVRGMDRALLPAVFPEFPIEWAEDPMNLGEEAFEGLAWPERLLSLQRLWEEMETRNPNQNVFR